MLNPEYLDGIAEPIKEIYSELETKIMMDIARRIAGANYVMTPSAEWQIYKLQQMGMTQEYIQQQIAKTLESSEKAVNKIFKEAGIKSIKTDIETQKVAIKAGLLAKDTIPLSAAEALTQVINENARRTNNTLRKLTKTMAQDANGKINKYLDMCQLMVQSGAFTQEAAIGATVKQFSREGIGSVDYASGMSIAIEAAVRRACVTGINQATSRVSLNNAELLGTDLVEVTSHADARPDHAEWQGLIYSISGNSKKYRKLSEATGYGTVSGLCGANCRHSFYAYIEGISERVKPEKYDQERYEAEQKQRYNERKIREWKKRAATMRAAGYDATLYDNKVSEWQAIQRKHLESTGLTRDYNREKIGRIVVKSSKSDIINVLPNVDNAKIPVEKFTQYALNAKKDPNKARAFQEALGYNEHNADKLIYNIKEHIKEFEAIEKPDNGYGKRYSLLMGLIGENGKLANVQTAWIIDKSSGELRLTSAYVKKKK